ncbi:hypothetical protein AAFC00_005681 [Neodothiora populina]|uniref:Pre-mRNA-splicing factor SLU7 n=1 Tax=Neodothiora populina TaxID=2781224 RepID=A0ABR3P5G8_9PEZI
MPPPQPPPKKPTEPIGKNERNEYIPSFISKKPFYIDESTTDDDYLEHQRLQNRKDDPLATSKWYSRGQRAGPAATKYRKGACENCGAITHKTKECLSRPRKSGAKWTGKDIQADEVIQDVDLGWDAKRDRWNGYDAREYEAVIEEYNALEEMKKKVLPPSKNDGDDDDDDEEKKADEEEGARYEEETDMGRHQSTSTRNLRLREDTAKYLVDLDLESARYDPKTRSMIDQPPPDDAIDAAAEGFARAASDAAEFEKAQRYAWEGTAKSGSGASNIHLQANPTQAQFLRKKELEERESKKEAQRKALLDRYGGAEHLMQDPLRQTAVVENERYVEYDERGRIKGEAERKEKSIYAEDVLVNNHTSVWGSWWKEFKWGYACCHSVIKASYCTGDEGIRAAEQAERLALGQLVAHDSQEIPKEIAWKEEESSEKHIPNADTLQPQKQPQQDSESRKRKIDEIRAGVTEQDMEKYRRKRTAANDPMAKLLGKDELIEYGGTSKDAEVS